MDKKTILVYDSGIGGLNVLLKLKKLRPEFEYLYMSDKKNAPYGKKAEKELFELAYTNILRAKKYYDFSICVLACNTLSTRVKEKLELSFSDIIFYGSYPFVNVADFGATLLVGTKATINSVYIMKAKREKKLLETLDLSDLVLEIENNLFDVSKIDLQKHFLSVRKDFNFLLLGCTHFCFLKDEFSKVFPKSTVFTEVLGMNIHNKGFLSTFCQNKIKSLKMPLENFIFEDKMRNFEVYDFLLKNIGQK